MKLFPLFRKVACQQRPVAARHSRLARHEVRTLGSGFMQLEDRIVLSAVGLAGGMPEQAAVAAEVQVAAHTSLPSTVVSQTAGSESKGIGTSIDFTLPASAVAAAHSARIREEGGIPSNGNQNPPGRPDRELPSQAVEEGGQDPPGNASSSAWKPVEYVGNTLPVVEYADPADDVSPSLPDNGPDIPNSGNTNPPVLSDPDSPSALEGSGGDALPGQGPQQPSTSEESHGGTPPTLPNGSSTQDSHNLPDGDSGGAKLFSPDRPFLPLNGLSADKLLLTHESHTADHIADRELGPHPLPSNAALDAAIADMFAATELELVDEVPPFDQGEISGDIKPETPVQDAAVPGLADSNQGDDISAMASLLSDFAPGLSQRLTQVFAVVATGDVSLVMKAFEDLLDTLSELGEPAGPMAQASFASCLLTTLAAVGAGFEIAHRQWKRDREGARADSEDEALPPDMLLPMANLS